jgi:hypothetical protein
MQLRPLTLAALTFATLFSIGTAINPAAAQSNSQTIDFESLETFNDSGPTGDFFNGYAAGAETGIFETGGLIFPTQEFGPGWSYSQVVDNETRGFGNQFAAFPGSGSGGSETYALAFALGESVSFSSPQPIQSIDITNATFTYFSLLEGDQFANPIGGDDGNEPGFFSVTISGTDADGNETGSFEHFLADFRSDDSEDDFIVEDWQTVDVSDFNATTLTFTLDGSDTSNGFLNTPAYFALDNVVVATTPVPEPSTALLIVSLAGALGIRRRR